MTIPSSQTPVPATFTWPPPRTAISRSWSRAKRTAEATSAAPLLCNALRRDRLPDRRVVIRFDFTRRQRRERFWLLIEHGETEICKEYPGLAEDLYVTAEAEAFVKWHAGQLTWAEATCDRRIELHGPSWLVRDFPTWNGRSMFAHIKPVSRAPASAAG